MILQWWQHELLQCMYTYLEPQAEIAYMYINYMTHPNTNSSLHETMVKASFKLHIRLPHTAIQEKSETTFVLFI